MRRNRAATRTLAPDSRYRSRLVQQVTNKVMLHGKKSTAERIVYDALAIVGERTGRNPTDVLDDEFEDPELRLAIVDEHVRVGEKYGPRRRHLPRPLTRLFPHLLPGEPQYLGGAPKGDMLPL